MRNLLALIGAVVVLFVGLGWYLGWYKFAIEPSANGQQRIQLDVNTDKILSDTKTAGERVGHVIQGIQTGDPSKAQAPEFVGPPLPPDMPTRGTPPGYGSYSAPTRR
jgi:hypothetical protein